MAFLQFLLVQSAFWQGILYIVGGAVGGVLLLRRLQKRQLQATGPLSGRGWYIFNVTCVSVGLFVTPVILGTAGIFRLYSLFLLG